MRPISSFRSAVFTLAVLGVAASFGQDKPPASIVPEPYRQKFVYYVDRRSISEKVLNLIGLTSQDVGRSFALIAGVTKYPNMPELDRELPAAGADIDELQEYLKNQEFFDEIVVLRDSDVTIDNFEYFLQNYFPDRLRNSPKSRFLFVYSGHGMVEGSQQNPTGYLLKSTARNFQDKLNGVNMSVLRVYLDQEIDTGYQTLILINACHSGAFLSRRSFGGPESQLYLPKYSGAHAITSGGSNQLSWHDPNVGPGSVFFEKLLAGLGGPADTLPVNADGTRGNGVITVEKLYAYLYQEVSTVTNQDQTPMPADLAPNGSQGGFFFLNRQRMIAQRLVPDWNPSRASSFGVDAEQKTIQAKRYYRDGQYDQAVPLFRRAAEAGNGEAATYLANSYMRGHRGLPKDEGQAVIWYKKAAEAGNAQGMNNLGTMYTEGRGGLPHDEAQAVIWYKKAAEAGNTSGMYNLGTMYAEGRGGLPHDDVQAVSWYRKAAEAGDAGGMNNLGTMYESGRGGLQKDDLQAVNWYKKAAEAGNAGGMTNLGVMYVHGRGGLQKDDAQAESWIRKGAEAGDAHAMADLGRAYELGQIGLPKDAAQAVFWYRKAEDLGDEAALQALRRLGH